MKIIIEYDIIESEKGQGKVQKTRKGNQMKITNIEQVDHFYMKKIRIEMYVVRYASGKNFRYWNESHLPKTVKAAQAL